jgi:DNA-binding CsgD family transcriptional regulator
VSRQVWGDWTDARRTATSADVAVPPARGADGRAVEARAVLAVFEAAGTAVALVDRDGRMHGATAAFEHLLAADGHRPVVCDAARELVQELRRDVAWGREPRPGETHTAARAVPVAETAYRITVARPAPARDDAPPARAPLLPVLVERIAAATAAARPERAGDAQVAIGLSRREMEVARELAAGRTTAQAAAALGISVHTARHHAERAYAKLGVRSRAALGALLGGAADKADLSRRPPSPRR